MITLDLFESDDNKPQAAYVPVGPHYPGSKNRALGNANIAAIMKSLDTPNTPPVTLNFLDGTSRQLNSEEINLIADYYDTFQTKADRANFIYRTLLSRNKMFQLLYRLKQQQLDFSQGDKDQEPPEPEQLALFQEQKKSSEEKFKSTRLDRLKTQARARHPSAASDTEALVADFVDQQDQDQEEFNKVKTVNRRQDDLLKQITALNKSQEREIDDLEAEEANLQQNIQQLRAANAELAKKLSGMTARRQSDAKAAPEPAAITAPATQQPTTAVAPGPGVSVATDKVKPSRAVRYTPIGKTATRKPGQLARGPVGTASIDGQDVEIFAPRQRLKTAEIPGGLRGAGLRQQAMQEVHDIPFGMTENEARSIPQKMVVQGYTVEYEPIRRMVTVSRRGQLVGRAPNKPGSYNNYQLVVNRIIDASEEDKYPDDLEARGVERPFGESQEELSAQDVLFRTAAKAMYDANREGVDIDYEEAIKIASRLMNIPYAPSMLPALQQQLADVEKKIATLKSVRKSQRQREREKVTHQTTADEQRRAEEWMKNYGQSLQRRLQTRQTESADEKKSSTAYQEGGRAAYYGRPSNNPYKPGTKEHADYKRGYRDFRDEGKDYGIEKKKQSPSIDQDRDFLEAQDQSQPGDDILKNLFKDFGKIFDQQPEQDKSEEPKKEVKEMGRAGYNPLTSEKHWHEVEKHLFDLINNKDLDAETRAEAKQRYLEKQREAKLKGFKE